MLNDKEDQQGYQENGQAGYGMQCALGKVQAEKVIEQHHGHHSNQVDQDGCRDTPGKEQKSAGGALQHEVAHDDAQGHQGDYRTQATARFHHCKTFAGNVHDITLAEDGDAGQPNNDLGGLGHHELQGKGQLGVELIRHGNQHGEEDQGNGQHLEGLKAQQVNGNAEDGKIHGQGDKGVDLGEQGKEIKQGGKEEEQQAGGGIGWPGIQQGMSFIPHHEDDDGQRQKGMVVFLGGGPFFNENPPHRQVGNGKEGQGDEGHDNKASSMCKERLSRHGWFVLLYRAFAEQHSRDGFQENLQVQPQRPFFNILEIQFQPFVEGQVAAA